MRANDHVPAWRLWVPLLFQTAIIIAIPAQSAYTRLAGKTVVLQTVPVDPYELLQGYSIKLNYDISSLETLQKLPGGRGVSSLAPGTSLYVVLERPTSSTPANIEPWKPVRVSSDRPAVAANQVILKGMYTYGFIKYGLETYYIPEEQRSQINREFDQSSQGGQKQSTLVEIKVDAQGNAVPVSFWVSGTKTGQRHNYRF